MTSYTSVFRYFFASLLLFNFGLNADRASAISWNISGPGTSQVILDGDSVTFTYELDVRRTYGVFVWDISGGIFEPGPIAYDPQLLLLRSYRRNSAKLQQTAPMGERIKR